MTRILCCLLMTAAGLFADVSGKWSGSFDVTGPDGQVKSDTAFLSLKQDGNALTGTAGPNEDHQMAIRAGKVDGDKITFEVAFEEGGVLKFELALEEDHIKGNVQGEAGDEKISAK